MDYIIIGSGPSGLSLAYILSKNNYNVTLIEKDNQLGGSWKSEWIDLYFTEGSPRVLGSTGAHIEFLHDIGMKESDFKTIYGTMLETNMKLFTFIKEYFNFYDYLIFILEMIFYRFRSKNMVLQQWLNNSLLSEKAKEAIKIISITICDTPKNTNLFDFFGSISGGVDLLQMKDPNQWNIILDNYFQSISNIHVYKGTEVIGINSDYKGVRSVTCVKNNNEFIIDGKKIVLCTQSNGIYPILKNSNRYVQNNWHSLEWIKKWSENTFYSGFGFQLHFNKTVQFPEKWCWACKSEWNIIILPVSNWLTVPSKDPDIQTVWSCCIVDMDTKSNRLDKTPNECTKNEIINECLFQLKQMWTGIPTPDVITVSPKIYKQNGKWVSNTTGFTRKDLGYLPMKGKLNGLFAIGCFTEGNYHTIAYMKTAVEASKKFLNIYEPNTIGFHKNITCSNTIILLLIVFLIFIKL